MFTNVENRQEEQLMAELAILPSERSYEEQRRIKEKWDRSHPRSYMLPGENEGGHL